MKKDYLILFLACLTTSTIGWFMNPPSLKKSGDIYTAATKIVREKSTQYTFTSPFLFTDNGDVTFTHLDPLKNRIEAVKDKALASNEASAVSVYFRDLNNTQWTGVDVDATFDPASLKKVVLLVAYLRAAEDDPSLATKMINYHGNADSNEHYKSEHTLKKGQNYPIRDLIVDMIVKSGNDSANSIFENFDSNKILEVYTDLGIPFPKSRGVEEITPKIYSRIFRILYGSTYLQRDLSEEVLSLLSQTEFNKGLKTPLPQNILVAHKFGERITPVTDGPDELQLHDCGIVYYPDHPYFLCVMTKGHDFAKLEKVISDISSVTYSYWDKSW